MNQEPINKEIEILFLFTSGIHGRYDVLVRRIGERVDPEDTCGVRFSASTPYLTALTKTLESLIEEWAKPKSVASALSPAPG